MMPLMQCNGLPGGGNVVVCRGTGIQKGVALDVSIRVDGEALIVVTGPPEEHRRIPIGMHTGRIPVQVHPRSERQPFRLRMVWNPYVGR